jgi:probable selenium-dependent hydroxylase accessory protein YqeC
VNDPEASDGRTTPPTPTSTVGTADRGTRAPANAEAEADANAEADVDADADAEASAGAGRDGSTPDLRDAVGVPTDGSGAAGWTLAVVGAGGKKSLLYALAARAERAVVTSTVRIPPPEDRVASVVVDRDPLAALERVDEWPAALLPERERPDRFVGYEPGVVGRLAAAAPGPVLVKADGARSRLLKAPAEHEPRVPPADVVVPVASARAVGEPLDEGVVHRPERVAAVAGLSVGDELTPRAVGRVLASPDGGRRDVGTATVVPVVNMVDDDRLEGVARAVAREVHARAAVPRVVLTRLVAPSPVVAVVDADGA